MPDVLRPLFDQVVIKELEPDRMRRSGLLVPEGTSDVPPNEGIVLAAGAGPPELQCRRTASCPQSTSSSSGPSPAAAVAPMTTVSPATGRNGRRSSGSISSSKRASRSSGLSRDG